jgi:uncharacterized protein YjiS (DUF1127 family)
MVKIKNIRWINQSSSDIIPALAERRFDLAAPRVRAGDGFARPYRRRMTMTITTHAADAMHRPARPAVRVVNVIRNVYTAWKNRRDFYRLGEMSDTQLADIGLARSDLNVVVDLRFGSDPTVYLGSIAEARRREIEACARQVS